MPALFRSTSREAHVKRRPRNWARASSLHAVPHGALSIGTCCCSSIPAAFDWTSCDIEALRTQVKVFVAADGMERRVRTVAAQRTSLASRNTVYICCGLLF
jgi:hypothetical protein